MPKKKGKKSAINDIDLGLPPEEPPMDDWDSDGANGAPQQSRAEATENWDEDHVEEPPEQPRRRRDMNDDSDDDEPQRKKKKKKKKKKKRNDVDDAESFDAPPVDSAPPSEDISNEISELSEQSGGKRKKKKKKNKRNDASPPPPFDDIPDEVVLAEEEPPSQNKKKKKKKKKKKGRAADEDDFDDDFGDVAETQPPPPAPPADDEEDGGGGGKKKKKKKKKNKNKKSLAQRAEEKQQELFKFSQSLSADLEDDLVDMYDDEQSEMFEGFVREVLMMYEDDNALADDEEFFEEQKAGIENFWGEIVSNMRELQELMQQEENEEAAVREREERIADLKRRGLNIGPSGGSRQRVDRKAEEKRLMREKLRQARLLLQQQQEATDEDEDEDDGEEDGDDEDEDKESEEKESSGAKADSDWDDSDEEDAPKPPPRKAASRQQPKRSAQRRGRRNDSDSDDDAPRQQKKRKNRRRGGGAGQQQPQQQQRAKPKAKPKQKPKGSPPAPSAANAPTSSSTTREERKTSSQQPRTEQKQQDEPPTTGKKKKKKVPLRSPICVVMGHVDAGKTKILDKIRQSDVQGGEVGGITQQIGATYLSIENVKARTELLREQFSKLKYKVPGLLFIDTPGHESFSNLRSRGSSMCDIAVVVVNIMEGLQPQTIESLNLLRDRGAQFVVAVNQIDRLNQWVPMPDAPFKTTLDSQNRAAKNHFESLMSQLQVQFAEHEWNTALYYENKRYQEDMSLVPVSAHTGEGLPDLLMVVVTLTQKFMSHQLELSLAAEDFRCTILEVKTTVGHGATIDVILSNGLLRKDDSIVVCGMRGPIVTPIRGLLLPHEAQEMRVKGEYRLVDEVPASAGIRISAHDLATAVAGSSVLLVPRNLPKRGPHRGQILEALKDEVQGEFARIMSNVSSTNQGVYVQASTLGALEALVKYLGDMNVPICGINIGDVHKSDVIRAGVMLESRPEFALILAFNVRVTTEAEQIARQSNVRIFSEEIIYHLFDRFSEYIERHREEKKRRARDIAVFPCRLEILPEHIINARKPLIMGCLVRRGCLRLRTPLVAQKPGGDYVYLGRVDSIQSEQKDQEVANVGDKVAVKILDPTATVTIQFGRQFDASCPLVSLITRESIDALKANFRDDITGDDVQHIRELKKYFNVVG